MKKIILGNYEYELIKNNNGYDEELISNLYTDYFEPFDYVVGDFSYDKLRLKGFYDKNNNNATSINNIDTVDDYIKNYCSYGCRYFILKKSHKNG